MDLIIADIFRRMERVIVDLWEEEGLVLLC